MTEEEMFKELKMIKDRLERISGLLGEGRSCEGNFILGSLFQHIRIKLKNMNVSEELKKEIY